MSDKASKRRVVMAKLVALRWVEGRTTPEYRLKVLYGAKEIRKVPQLLRSFRDGKIKLGSVEPIRDLGIQEGFDHLIVWSSQRQGMIELQGWFESRGCETSGVW